MVFSNNKCFSQKSDVSLSYKYPAKNSIFAESDADAIDSYD